MSLARLDGSNLEAVKQLLEANALPVSDLSPAVTLLGRLAAGRLVGVVGLEALGSVGLLRSLAVEETQRGGGLGAELVSAIERLAREKGIAELYLLTTTAESYFVRRGYQRIPREEAPATIRLTTEFSSICPASSALMRKNLPALPTS